MWPAHHSSKSLCSIVGSHSNRLDFWAVATGSNMRWSRREIILCDRVASARGSAPVVDMADVTDRPQHDARWTRFVSGTLITISFAAVVVWSARSYGRTLGFGFGVNWILMAWAILLGRVLQSQSGSWDGLSLRLPACHYVTRPFEKGGRVYDYLGVRWYQRLLRPWL
jgi:hypothetical protein